MFRSIDMRWRRIGAAGIVAFGLITAVCISLLANSGAVHGGAASKPWSSPATRGQVNLARTVNVSHLPTMGHAAPSITIPLHGAMLAVGPNSAYARNAPHQAGFPYSPTAARPPQKSPDVVGTSAIPLLYKNGPEMTAATLQERPGNDCCSRRSRSLRQSSTPATASPIRRSPTTRSTPRG